MTARVQPPRNLHERAERTSAVVARFRGRPFDWKHQATCIHLLRAQLVAFGHRTPLVPRFRSLLGAERALRATGHHTLAGLLDSLLPRLDAPALAWVGDIVLLPGTAPFDAITLHAGGGALIGWHDSDLSGLKGVTDAMGDVIGAWRV